MSNPQNQNFQKIETEIDLSGPDATKAATASAINQALGNQSAHSADQVHENLEIEVVDDTPEKDRGKAREEPLPEAPTGIIPSDDELKTYSESVQKRMKRMTYEYHEQRRQREAAERQVEEAARLAQELYKQNQLLRGSLKTGEKQLVEQAKGRIEAQLEAAKEKYRKAHEMGDTEAIINAQSELADLQARKVQVEAYQPQYQQEEPQRPPAVPPQRSSAVPKPDADAERWAAKNPWFQKDPEMTSTAFGVHQKLVQERGIDPRREPETYYAELDKAMRKRFPEYEWGDAPARAQAPEQPARRAQPSTVVAPATRNVSSMPTSGSVSQDGRKVTLTSSQLSIAKRLGLTPQQYAAEFVKQHRGS